MSTHTDHELAMANAQLHETAHMANHIHSLLHDLSTRGGHNGEIKAWVQSKLTRVHHDLSDVRTYLRGICCSTEYTGDKSSCGCMTKNT